MSVSAHEKEDFACATQFLTAWVASDFPGSAPKVEYGIFRETKEHGIMVTYTHTSREHDGSLSLDRMIERLEDRLPNVTIEPIYDNNGHLGFFIGGTPSDIVRDICLPRTAKTPRKQGR